MTVKELAQWLLDNHPHDAQVQTDKDFAEGMDVRKEDGFG